MDPQQNRSRMSFGIQSGVESPAPWFLGFHVFRSVADSKISIASPCPSYRVGGFPDTLDTKSPETARLAAFLQRTSAKYA